MAQQLQADAGQLDQLPVIEHLTIVTPLGLRFWDEVSARVIGDGLIVTAYPELQPNRRVLAVSNPSGIYTLQHLPGLRAVENGAGDAAFWDTHPPRWPFIIEVVDSVRRFQPFLLSLALPVRGLVDGQAFMGGSPPGLTFGVPLYSTANRSVPAATAVIRADLWDPQAGPDHQGGPAAWAVLEAQVPGRPAVRGVADGQGRVVLIFAYPEILTNGLNSPPASSPLSPLEGGMSLREQAWPITLQATYERRDPVPQILPLVEILAQPPARLWDNFQQIELTQVTLRFGQELVLKSSNVQGRPRSELWITPAGSPP